MAPSRRAFIAIVVASALALSAGGGAGAARGPASMAVAISTTDAEYQFLQNLNQERARHGLRALNRDTGLSGVALDWSNRMAAEWKLYHRPDLVAQVESRVTRDWHRLGENVGYGYSVESLHKAFNDSPGHFANVIGDYNRVGIGVSIRDARIWVTFNFMKGSEIFGPTGIEAYPNIDVWLVGTDGNVYNFGALPHYGSMYGTRLVQPVVGGTGTVSGNGYWLVATDGGIFSFGDARFFGSTGSIRLNQPIVGMAPTPTGNGYWLVASDGGIFTFGEAHYYGAASTIADSAVMQVLPTHTGRGYYLVGSNGRVYRYGDAGSGVSAPIRMSAPLTAIARA